MSAFHRSYLWKTCEDCGEDFISDRATKCRECQSKVQDARRRLKKRQEHDGIVVETTYPEKAVNGDILTIRITIK